MRMDFRGLVVLGLSALLWVAFVVFVSGFSTGGAS